MNHAPARILIFSSSYAPVVGGMQTVAHNLAKQLLARHHSVRVVTNRYPVNLPPRENVEGVLVDRIMLLPPSAAYLRHQRPDLFLASLYYGPKLHWRLTNLFREFRPDVVNVHFPDHQIDAVLKLRKRFDFKLVVSLHGDDIERFTMPVYENGSRGNVLRLRSMLQAATAVTAVSRDLLAKATAIEPAIEGKSHVINNGIDYERFAERSCHRHSRPYVVGVGRLVHKKGFDLLIEAFSRCNVQQLPDLIIAGTGEERDALQQQVNRLQLTEKVHFFGPASPEEVVKLMNGSLGVVVPSRQEPFGIVALEALAAGKPLLATKTGGLEELLRDIMAGQNSDHGSSAFLVEPTVAGLTDGLERVLTVRPNKSDCNRVRLDEFFWPNVSARYEELLLANGNRNGVLV